MGMEKYVFFAIVCIANYLANLVKYLNKWIVRSVIRITHWLRVWFWEDILTVATYIHILIKQNQIWQGDIQHIGLLNSSHISFMNIIRKIISHNINSYVIVQTLVGSIDCPWLHINMLVNGYGYMDITN